MVVRRRDAYTLEDPPGRLDSAGAVVADSGTPTLLRWLARLLSVRGRAGEESLQAYAEQLLAEFTPALVVEVSGEPRSWYAYLQRVSEHDHQVVADVRLVPERDAERERVADVQRVPELDTEREWVYETEDAAPLRGHGRPPASVRTYTVEEHGPEREKMRPRFDPLVLYYTFPQYLSLERNIALFREFAANALIRLRVAPTGGAVADPPVVEHPPRYRSAGSRLRR